MGEFPVRTKLEFGSERLRLIFTSSRIIVDHLGKRGTGAAAGSGIFGMLSSGVEDLFKGGRETIKKKSMQNLNDPGKILKSHKDNFGLTYQEIVNVTLVRSPLTLKLSVLTQDAKYEFTTGTKFDTVVSLLRQVVATKLMVRTE